MNLTANALKAFCALDPCDMRKSFNDLALADPPRNYRPPGVISI